MGSQQTVNRLLNPLGPVCGSVVVGASAIQVHLPSQLTDIGVRVKADDDNAGSVYIGSTAGVLATNGYRLKAGQELELHISDVAQLFAIASGVGQLLYWMAR